MISLKSNFKSKASQFKILIDSFTMIEVVISIAIIGTLLTIAIPSSQRWVRIQSQNAYIGKVSTFLLLVRRESRRWGNACSISPSLDLDKSLKQTKKEVQGFQVACTGKNKQAIASISNATPLISKSLFQEVNNDIYITAKGMISLPNATEDINEVIILVGGRDESLSILQQPKCIVIDSPGGNIRHGIYQEAYSFNRPSSIYNRSLDVKKCL